MRKSIDRTFLHYGIRTEDMELIEQTCLMHGIDAEWLKTYVLKPYHDERNKQNMVDEKTLTKILKFALKKTY